MDFEGFKQLVDPKSKPLFGGFSLGGSLGPMVEDIKARFDEQNAKSRMRTLL